MLNEGGKLPAGTTEIPFEFLLKPASGQQLHDTYHGVYVNVQYVTNVTMPRGAFAKDLSKSREFFVELAPDDEVMKKVGSFPRPSFHRNPPAVITPLPPSIFA